MLSVLTCSYRVPPLTLSFECRLVQRFIDFRYFIHLTLLLFCLMLGSVKYNHADQLYCGAKSAKTVRITAVHYMKWL